MAATFRFDRRWSFPCSAEDLWAVLERVEDYPSWWPWLRRFDLDPARLEAGARARCVVTAPVTPFSLRLAVDLVDVVPGRSVEAAVRGNLVGRGSLLVTPLDGTTCTARLRWDVEVAHRALGPLARAARPLAARGQDWVVATGVRRFRRRHFP
jgi:hypothetical protein